MPSFSRVPAPYCFGRIPQRTSEDRSQPRSSPPLRLRALSIEGYHNATKETAAGSRTQGTSIWSATRCAVCLSRYLLASYQELRTAGYRAKTKYKVPSATPIKEPRVRRRLPSYSVGSVSRVPAPYSIAGEGRVPGVATVERKPTAQYPRRVFSSPEVLRHTKKRPMPLSTAEGKAVLIDRVPRPPM
jgi:hypothetical protein